MSKYVLKRIGQALIVLLLAYTLAFFLLSALPSDGVAARYADPALGLSQAEIEQIREQMGVDKPLIEQYFSTLGGLFTGNRGVIHKEPYGVTLVIGPSNAPILLLLDPAIAALAGLPRSIDLTLSSAHPSPLSARRGFFGARPFSRVNAWLTARGEPGIDWSAIT